MKQNWNSLKETQVSSERKYKLKMRNIEIILVLEYGNCFGFIFFFFFFFLNIFKTFSFLSISHLTIFKLYMCIGSTEIVFL